MKPITEEMNCTTCGGPLASGPFGLRCARCVLSLVEEVGSEEDSYVAELFPELHLEGQVAKGGFGAVYRAEHRRMRRTVALKFLDTLLARNPEAVSLFEQEMISVGGLDHPGIVRAHDAGERDGHWYIVMEFVDGMDCGALVRKHGHLPVAESCEIIRQAAVALGHAHGKGLVHRDVKPGNVMVSKGTEETKETKETEDVASVFFVPLVPASVKVLDFGLAGLAVVPVFSQPATTGGSTLFLGTLEYISPEQIESPDKVDARADLYSLGATLWRLLTGKTPHGGATPEMSLFVAMKRITSEPVPSLATVRPDLPKPLIQLCDAMLSLDREKRPASAAEVAHLLEPWCAGAELPRLFTDGPLEEKPFVFPKKNRRPLWGAAAAVLVAAGIGVAAFLAGNAAPPPVPPAPTAPGLEGTAVFSEKVARFHDIPAQNMPRLLSTEWVVEREHLSTQQLTKVDTARLRSDGRLMWINTGDTLVIEPGADGKREELKNLGGLHKFGVQPETGNLVWTRISHPDDLAIGRILLDGTKLAPLAPDFSKEGPEEARRAMKAERLARGYHDGCAYPWGIAFVTENTVPPGSGLRPGDVLYADEGHRDLYAFIRPLPFTKGTDPGLWKFRFDSDEPAQRLGSLSGTKEDSNYPLDVTVSRHGVFLLNRTATHPYGKAVPTDTNARVLRWESSGFKPCTTDQPIFSPAGIAADPLSADLFVLDGGNIVQPGVVEQRVLRLRPAGPDRYTVEPFARKFRGFSYCGLQITDDGQRMVITDEKLASVVVLKREAIEPTPGDDAQNRIAETPLAFPGWQYVRWLHHQSKFASPRFAPGTGVLYCSEKRLRLVPSPGEGAVDFFDKSLLDAPTFSGVSLTGHVAWTRMTDRKSPSIGRATTDRAMLEPLKFADEAPPLPGSFAFVTEANLPASTALRPGDALVAGSRNPEHAESTSGVWRFRFDNDEAPARLVAISDAAVNDVTLSKAGVFLLTDSGLQRWDGTTLHPVTTSEALHGPIALAADPLSSDLFVLEKQRLLRLRPTAPDSYTTEVLTEAIIDGVPAGLCSAQTESGCSWETTAAGRPGRWRERTKMTKGR